MIKKMNKQNEKNKRIKKKSRPYTQHRQTDKHTHRHRHTPMPHRAVGHTQVRPCVCASWDSFGDSFLNSIIILQ